MGKIGVYYNMSLTLTNNMKKCKNELKDQSDYVNKALRKLGKINEDYYELNKIYDNLNSIRSKSDSDVAKLDNFEQKLKKYIDMVKKSDDYIYDTP